MTDTPATERELPAAEKKLRYRLARIAEAHVKDVDEHGGTFGDCAECDQPWPCPTYVWATTDRDALAAPWHPTEDEREALR
jgi:hypothetical protein